MSITPEDILDYWLRDVGHANWFSNDQKFDAPMRAKFADIQAKAAREELSQWKKTPEGMLALILLLQEFPRRMFRGQAEAYASDDVAIEYARDAIVQHFDDRIDKTYKMIFYMPYSPLLNISDVFQIAIRLLAAPLHRRKSIF